jgi:hypothetical protein
MHHNLVWSAVAPSSAAAVPGQPRTCRRKRGGRSTAMEQRIVRTRALAALSVVGRGVGVDVALPIAEVQTSRPVAAVH